MHTKNERPARQYGANVNLPLLLSDSKSIVDLEARLTNKGVNIASHLEYHSILNQAWRASSTLQKTTQDCSEDGIPSVNVTVGTTTYHIHGLMHGMPGILFTPKKEVRKRVTEAKQLKNLPGTDYAYEQGMRGAFRYGFNMLDKENELRDHEFNGRSAWCDTTALLVPAATFGSIQYGPLIIQAAVGGLVASTVALIAGLNMMGRSQTPPQSTAEEIMQLSGAAARSMEGQIAVQRYLLEKTPPQPFDFEMNYIIESSRPVQALKATLVGLNVPTTSERSLWMAQQLITKADKGNLTDMHLFCGTGHSSEVAYFLQNPNYTFAHLEAYKKSKPFMKFKRASAIARTN